MILKANKVILIGSPRTGSYYVYNKLKDSSYQDFDEILFCKNNKDCKKVVEDKIKKLYV